jgi:pSer/pThr/pTyr-binding forkhead associated (FHA) protein
MDDDQPSYTRIIDPAARGAVPRPGPAGPHPALVWRPKLGDDQAFPLEGRTATIGRHEDNDIVLAGPTVSARHATVRREPMGVVLEDEGSLNGTFVNGQLVQQHLLEDGDQIQVGPHLLVFVPPAGETPDAS